MQAGALAKVPSAFRVMASVVVLSDTKVNSGETGTLMLLATWLK